MPSKILQILGGTSWGYSLNNYCMQSMQVLFDTMRWTTSLFYSSRAHVTPSSARGFERMERPPPASRRLLYLQVAANTAGWFVVSIFMTLFNKWLFTSSGMHFPLQCLSVRK